MRDSNKGLFFFCIFLRLLLLEETEPPLLTLFYINFQVCITGKAFIYHLYIYIKEYFNIILNKNKDKCPSF